MTSLFTDHDTLNIHKILGFGCLTHYGYRFYNAFRYGSMKFDDNSLITYLSPAVHLSLSLSSFIFSVPVYRFHSKAIIWRELQLHNIIFTSRSVCMMYHTLFFKELNPWYYYSRLAIVLIHHYLADIVTEKYQHKDKTTTRDIPYDTNNKWIPYINKKYYAMSQLFATCGILLSNTYDTGFGIMFPIQLSTFLMTLVRKNIISNNGWHIFYALSLAAPYFTNIHNMSSNTNDKFYACILFVFSRLFLGMNKYLNIILLTLLTTS